MTRKQASQSGVFLGNFARSALHVLGRGNALEFIVLDATLKVFDELFALIAGAPLILPDTDGGWRITSLRGHQLHVQDTLRRTDLLGHIAVGVSYSVSVAIGKN
jgi:hypothetical protein